MSIHETFKSMGLRAKESLDGHLLVENAFENNLLTDISKVDYLAGNMGRTQLQPLDGLPAFVDGVFVFGYLRQQDITESGGRVFCTTGEEGASKNILSSITLAAREALGKGTDGVPISASFLHTVSMKNNYNNNEKLFTLAMIARIEKENGGSVKRRWQAIYSSYPAAASATELDAVHACAAETECLHAHGTLSSAAAQEPAAVFVAKVDVSRIEFQSALPAFERNMQSIGYGIYSIDYSRDFAGTLDRDALVEYLCTTKGFKQEETLQDALSTRENAIIANTDQVGNNVCTWVITSKSGHTVKTTLYNNVVSNFETGEVQTSLGTHLAEYLACPNDHLGETFRHPVVQALGCTRVEVSLYGCFEHILSVDTAKLVIDEALETASPDNTSLFVIQPPKQQWNNLAACLDRCMVLANRPQGQIFVAWYAHTKNRKVAGVHVRPIKEVVADDRKWERAVRWAAADFGFRDCPIYRVDVQTLEPENIEIAPLQCYIKGPDTWTVLAASKKPVDLHPTGPDPNIILPETAHVSWRWRDKKCKKIGIAEPAFDLLPIPTTRGVSTLSTRARERRLQEIADALRGQEWESRVRPLLAAKLQPELLRRSKKLEKLRGSAKASDDRRRIGIETERMVFFATKGRKTLNLSELVSPGSVPTRYRVLGYQQPLKECRWPTEGLRIVLQRVPREEGGTASQPIAVWANKALAELLKNHADDFDCNWFDPTLHFLRPIDPADRGLQIAVQPAKSIYSTSGGNLWNRVDIVYSPVQEDKALLRAIEADAIEFHDIRQDISLASMSHTRDLVPFRKDFINAVHLPEGEYACDEYSTGIFIDESDWTLLHLYPVDENGDPTDRLATAAAVPTYGKFIQQEIERIGGPAVIGEALAPIRCRLWEVRTSDEQPQDRQVTLAAVFRPAGVLDQF